MSQLPQVLHSTPLGATLKIWILTLKRSRPLLGNIKALGASCPSDPVPCSVRHGHAGRGRVSKGQNSHAGKPTGFFSSQNKLFCKQGSPPAWTGRRSDSIIYISHQEAGPTLLTRAGAIVLLMCSTAFETPRRNNQIKLPTLMREA